MAAVEAEIEKNVIETAVANARVEYGGTFSHLYGTEGFPGLFSPEGCSKYNPKVFDFKPHLGAIK